MKRTVLALVVVLGLMVNMCASAMATENRVSQINPTLTFSGTTANCGVVIISIGDEIDATLELWKGNILIDSWPSKGTSYVSISEKCSVTKGATYTLKVSGTIDGLSINDEGITRTC